MIKKILIKIVKLYQKVLSPDHSFWAKKLNRPPYCKHIPSCSEYMIEAIEKKGVFIGVLKGIGRIFRCMPFTKGGYDPVDKAPNPNPFPQGEKGEDQKIINKKTYEKIKKTHK